MRILCISDIHGYAEPLQQVLTFGKAQGCTTVLAAGDLCFPGPQPLECMQLLASVHAHMVQGVSDLAVATLNPDDLPTPDTFHSQRVEALRQAQKQLGAAALKRLRRLPQRFRMTLEDEGELILVHGSPVDPTTSLSHDMTDEQMLELLGDAEESVVICGGDHVPFDRFVGDCRVIGVGSVGMSPTPNVAHAAIVDTSASGVGVRLVQLVLQ